MTELDTKAAELMQKMDVADLRTQLAAATARAEAAESALRLATHSTGSTTVLMTLDKYQELLAAVQRAEAAEAKLALVDAYGQYMRNAPKPRTFAEWLEWRESVRA